MRASDLVRVLPGHPSHPPLTDATIGAYAFSFVAAVLDVLGWSEDAAAHGWWLALIFALIVSAPTAATGFADWLDISPGTPLKRTATIHMAANVAATIAFALAAILGHSGFQEGDVTTVPFVFMVIGFGLLTLGGYLGGTIVFVHGMRVLGLRDEPTHRAVAPVATPEKKAAEGDEPPVPSPPSSGREP